MKVLSKYAFNFLFCVFIFSYKSSIIAERKAFTYEVLGKTLKESLLWLYMKEGYAVYGNYLNQFLIKKTKNKQKDYKEPKEENHDEQVETNAPKENELFISSDVECPKDRIKNYMLTTIFESISTETYPVPVKNISRIETVKKKNVLITNHVSNNRNYENTKVPKKQKKLTLDSVKDHTKIEPNEEVTSDLSKRKSYKYNDSIINQRKWNNNDDIADEHFYNKSDLQEPIKKRVHVCKRISMNFFCKTQHSIICGRSIEDSCKQIFNEYKMKQLHIFSEKSCSLIECTLGSLYAPNFLEVSHVNGRKNLPRRSRGIHNEQQIERHHVNKEEKGINQQIQYNVIENKRITVHTKNPSTMDPLYIYEKYLKSLHTIYLYIFRNQYTYIVFSHKQYSKKKEKGTGLYNRKDRNTSLQKNEMKHILKNSCFYIKGQDKSNYSKNNIPVDYNEHGWIPKKQSLLNNNCSYIPNIERNIQDIKRSYIHNTPTFTIKHETFLLLFSGSHKEFIKSMKKYVTDRINFSLYTDIISPEVYNCEKYKKIKWTLILFFIPVWFLINIVYITLVHKIQRQILNPLHRLLIFPSIIRLFFYVLLLIFCVQCSDSQSNTVEYTLMGYMALNTMFHTIFYGNLLLISKGYMVIRDNFEKKESISITLLICSIYIITSVNQVDMINTIPNILCLHIVLLCILVNNIMAIIKFLKYRLAFVRDVGITTWEESIRVKLNMYQMFLRLVIFFFASEISLHVGSLFFNSMTTNWLILEHTLELFTWILVLYLCRYRGDVLYFSLLYNNSTLQILPLYIVRNHIVEVEQFYEGNIIGQTVEPKTDKIRCRKESTKKEGTHILEDYNNDHKIILTDHTPIMFLHPIEYEGQPTMARLMIGLPEKVKYKKVGLCTVKKMMVIREVNSLLFEEPSEDLLVL